MQPIMSSHIKMNQPPTISNGYKNWWDVLGQNQQFLTQTRMPQEPLKTVQAPSYGNYAPQPISNVQNLQPMTLITNINRGCGCHGAK